MTRPLLLLLLPGCFAKLQSGEDTSPEADAETCDTVIDATSPFPGQTDAYWRAPLFFTFSAPDPTATVEAPFPGTQRWDDTGTVLTFTPDAPLSPATAYTVGVEFCGGTPEIPFSTSAYGQPIADPAALVGQTWALDLGGGRFVEGDGIAAPLSSFFDRSVLFQVTTLGAAGLGLRVGVSGSTPAQGSQDECFGTVDLSGVDTSEAPYFELDVHDFVFGAWEGDLALIGFRLEGTIAPDGTTVGGVAYSVVVPVSQLGAIFDYNDVDETCELIEDRGVPCEACPDGRDDMCVTISADQLEATPVDIDLVEIGAAPGGCD
jgi:hypothetical protein